MLPPRAEGEGGEGDVGQDGVERGLGEIEVARVEGKGAGGFAGHVVAGGLEDGAFEGGGVWRFCQSLFLFRLCIVLVIGYR